MAGWLCAVPCALFVFQFLCVDVGWLETLAQHKVQMLLVKYHLGYSVSPERIPLDPFRFDSSTLLERLQLLVNQLTVGLLLPCLSAWLLIDYRRLSRTPPIAASAKRRRWFVWPAIALLIIVLGRAPASIYCEFQAKALLATGNYAGALGWLNAALTFNPALDQVAYFHEERGQALYFLHNDVPGDDSRVYLASVYRQQSDYLDAYQQLLAVWQAHRSTPWVINEMSSTLERLAEFTPVAGGQLIRRQINDDSALPWLQTLGRVDPTNIYSRYVIARIEYDLHNYPACIAQMQLVIQLSADENTMSSAYTYLALSEAGQGQYVLERALLEQAINLDPDYRNNTAREELSGLR